MEKEILVIPGRKVKKDDIFLYKPKKIELTGYFLKRLLKEFNNFYIP